MPDCEAFLNGQELAKAIDSLRWIQTHPIPCLRYSALEDTAGCHSVEYVQEEHIDVVVLKLNTVLYCVLHYNILLLLLVI